MKPHRHIGRVQRRHLARSAARRNRRGEDLHSGPSPRTVAKAAAHEAYIDQVALDKLNGMETGKICREHYRKLCAKAKPKPMRQARTKQPREADTYRGARRIAERGTRMSSTLKAARLLRGETRSEADRRRASA